MARMAAYNTRPGWMTNDKAFAFWQQHCEQTGGGAGYAKVTCDQMRGGASRSGTFGVSNTTFYVLGAIALLGAGTGAYFLLR